MKRAAVILTFALLAALLPLAGRHFAPADPEPPVSFYWSAFLIYAIVTLAIVGPFAWRIFAARPASNVDARLRPFPWWGWLGVGLTLVAWVLAWTRFAWFEPLQLYTFTPLWLGYILIVNALTYPRTGHCLVLDRPGCFLALFPASAAFWWYFEYLNRYVQNWRYVGIEPLSALEYFIHATISFSTVLPAVLSTRDLLASFPRLRAGLTNVWPVRFVDSPALAWASLILGVVGFLLLGALPQQLYSMVWVAPVLVLTSLQALTGQRNLMSGLKRGDWRGVGLPALAALVCGFFWEMWNWYSLAHWEYRIPLVHRFPIFEMPVLGYGGYLPFGLVCAAIGDVICGTKEKHDG